MDITARLAEARKLTDYFRNFDSRGYDSYERIAPLLLDFIDGTDEEWRDTLGGVVIVLGGLNAETELEQWNDQVEGKRIRTEINAIWNEWFAKVAVKA